MLTLWGHFFVPMRKTAHNIENMIIFNIQLINCSLKKAYTVIDYYFLTGLIVKYKCKSNLENHNAVKFEDIQKNKHNS